VLFADSSDIIPPVYLFVNDFFEKCINFFETGKMTEKEWRK